MADSLWIDTPSILYQPSLLYHFFPTESMTTNAKWNAAIRGAFYIGVIMFVTGSSGLSSLMLLIIIMVTSVGVRYYKNNYSQNKNYKLYNTTDYKYYDNVTENFTLSSNSDQYNNVLQNNPFQSNPAEIDSLPKIATSSKRQCTQPVYANPFMNVMLPEYIRNPKRGKACTRREIPELKNEIHQLYDDTLSKDVSDVYNKTQSQREFFTMPYTTIPNKQGEYANWLYGRKRN